MPGMSARSIAWAATAVSLRCRASIGMLGVALLVACPGRQTPKPQPIVDDTPLRIRVAQAEARREAGQAELIDLATHGTKPERLLALRGLGRIGGARSLETLVATLSEVTPDPDPELVGAAAAAIGVATSLDERDAGTPKLTAALIAALPRAKDHDVHVIEAIGRAADPSAQVTLVAGLGAKPAMAAACAIALGRFGRRKLPLIDEARDALVNTATHPDPAVRLAAIYALSREQLAMPPRPASADEDARQARTARAIVGLIADDVPEIRATAVATLARRKWVTPHRKELAIVLRDRDWRVAVEAVRALTGEASDDAGRDAVAGVLGIRFDQLVKGEATDAHVVIEALRGLAAHTGRAPIAAAIEAIASRTGAATALPTFTRAWIECLAIVAAARGSTVTDFDPLLDAGRCRLPDHLRLPLLAELITAKVGTLAARRGALRTLLSHRDARVRVAGMGTFAALWPEGDDADHRAAVATIIAALGSGDPIVAGNAVETATAIYERVGEGRDELDAALIARARIEKEPELAAALFELIGKRRIAAGASACRGGLAGSPVPARAAVTCLEALGEPTAKATLTAATPPPVDVTQVIGKQLRWHLMTTRGDVVIVLRPDLAPWAVATIVTLTRKGFYDGLEVHRVVPNFVVQGGDPTQSGWGGPGFTIPAESSSGDGFVAGGVGIADSGRDSGGSQWFVMHGRAPHLDGRYTWVGAVESGQKSADALLIGDQVVRAVIEIGPPPTR